MASTSISTVQLQRMVAWYPFLARSRLITYLPWNTFTLLFVWRGSSIYAPIQVLFHRGEGWVSLIARWRAEYMQPFFPYVEYWAHSTATGLGPHDGGRWLPLCRGYHCAYWITNVHPTITQIFCTRCGCGTSSYPCTMNSVPLVSVGDEWPYQILFTFLLGECLFWLIENVFHILLSTSMVRPVSSPGAWF